MSNQWMFSALQRSLRVKRLKVAEEEIKAEVTNVFLSK